MNKSRKATVVVSASIPYELSDFSKKFAKDRGMLFSDLVRSALAEYCGFTGSVSVEKAHGHGGDLSRFKTAQTHVRVCEKMRAAKAAKGGMKNG